jgi:hypothetical protein
MLTDLQQAFKDIFPWLILWPLEKTICLDKIPQALSNEVLAQRKLAVQAAATVAQLQTELDSVHALEGRLQTAQSVLTTIHTHATELKARHSSLIALTTSQIEWARKLQSNVLAIDVAILDYTTTLNMRAVSNTPLVPLDFAGPLMRCVDAATFDGTLVEDATVVVFLLGCGQIQDYFDYKVPKYKSELLQTLWDRYESPWVEQAIAETGSFLTALKHSCNVM